MSGDYPRRAMSRNEMKGIANELKTQLLILGGLVALMWAIEIIDQLPGMNNWTTGNFVCAFFAWKLSSFNCQYGAFFDSGMARDAASH
jgi:hypothetical protein